MADKNEDVERHVESRRLLLTAVILIVVQVIIACVAYTLVPAQVPLHWNALGQVDRYGSKLEGLWFSPILSLFILVLVRRVVASGSYVGRENQRVAAQFTDYVIIAVIVLMQLIQLIIIAVSLRIPINATSIVFIAVSLLFIGIGNYMGKLRRNGYAGIRTPWTMADDTVWERTHRLGGWLFVVAGVIGLIAAFVPSPVIRIVGLLAPILLVSIITVIYSYIEYQRVVGRRDRPRPL